MMRRRIIVKALASGVTIFLVALILFVLVKPATAVHLDPGTPSSTSVIIGDVITFNNVNLTIPAAEAIPVNYLNFSIRQSSNNQEIAYVHFSIQGSKTLDSPSGNFNVTNVTNTANLPFSASSGYGYDENTGYNVNFGYGYGYSAGSTDLTILYRITYKTHAAGTFYAKLYVNCTNHTFISGTSTAFTVTSTSGGGGGGLPPSEGGRNVTASAEVIHAIETQFGIHIPIPFYANDTNGDGILDRFTDPNHVLTEVRFVNISVNEVILLSTNGDSIPEFFWNTTTNSISAITYVPAANLPQQTVLNTTAKEITLLVTLNKTGWIYIDITDSYPPTQYPNYHFSVQTQDGRIIPANHVWRENGKIYVLDDPSTQYQFIYAYDVLPTVFQPSSRTFNASFVPADGTIFTVTRPVIHVMYDAPVTIIAATFGRINIINQFTTTDNHNFTYQPTYDLAAGTYVLSITAQNDNGTTLTSTATYTINPPKAVTTTFPWLYIIIAVILLVIIIAVLIILRRRAII
jgi:hypothetical protein